MAHDPKTTPAFSKPIRLPGSATAIGRALTALAAASAFAAAPAHAGPKGGVVKGGEAKITTRGGETTIRQGTERVVIDWKSFDIDAGEAVEFLQPGADSIALNRVLSDLPTSIRGQLQANGNVWIVNQHGVVFHAGSMIDVGGLLATTADISNADFMAGNYRFDKPGDPDAKIVNEGSITFGQAGLTAFVAPGVENRGVIAGRMGKVVIAGAETFAVDLAGDGMWAFTMGEGASGASARNTGRIHNPGGYILISATAAQGMVESQVSVGGVVEAKTAEVVGGKIVLSGDGAVEVSGKLDATGAEAGEVGGGVEITGETVRLTSAAEIDVSGDAGGGSVKIGGDYQGGGDLKTAANATVERGAQIKANVIGEVGDGGEVIVWSDETTRFFGTIEARGGDMLGDGGFAEVSGKGQLAFGGFVDLSAPGGEAGTLLLDPENIFIVNAGTGADDAEVDPGVGNGGAGLAGEVLLGDRPGEDLLIGSDALVGAMADIVLQAANNITVDDGLALGAYALTLEAGNDVILNDAITTTGSVTLTADADGIDGGGISFAAGITLTGGDVTLSAADDLVLGSITASGTLTVTTDGSILQAGGAVALDVDGASSFTSNDDATISLYRYGNLLSGAITLTGGGLALVNAQSTTLGAIDGTGNLTVRSTGEVTQTGDLMVDGLLIVNADDAGTRQSITLDQANEIGTGARLTGDDIQLNASGTLTLDGVDAAGDLDLDATGAIDQTAAAVTVSGTTTLNAGQAITLATDPNTASATTLNNFVGAITVEGATAATIYGTGSLNFANVATTSATPVNNIFRSLNNDITLAGDVGVGTSNLVLRATGGAISQTSGTIASGYLVSNAGAAATLNQSGNAILATSSRGAGAFDVATSTSLDIRGVTGTDLTVMAGSDVTDGDGTSIAISGAADITSTGGDIELNNLNAVSGTVALSGDDVLFNSDVAVQLADVNATNDLTITTTNDDITQAMGAAILADDSDVRASFSAGTGAITLLGDNDFASAGASGNLSLAGGALQVRDIDGVRLAAATGTSLNLTAENGIAVIGVADPISIDGPIVLSSESTLRINVDLTTTAGDLTLISDADADPSPTGDLDILGGVTVTAAGTLTLNPNDAVLRSDEANETVTLNAGAALVLPEANFAGGLIVDAAGAITQTGAVSVVDVADLTATGGGVALEDAGNDFATVDASGENISLKDANAITLGDIDTTGTLTVEAGTMIDDGDPGAVAGDDVDVGGVATLVAGTNITLEDALNDFGGVVDASGVDVSLRDAGDLALGDIDATGMLTAEAGAALTDDAEVGAGRDINVGLTADFTAATTIAIDDATNVFGGAISLDAATASLTTAGAAQLGAVDADDLTVTASGTITDTDDAAIIVTNTATFIAQSGIVSFDVQLDNDDLHDFSETGTLVVTGGDIEIDDLDGVRLGAVTANVNADAAIPANTGALTIDAGAEIAQADGTILTVPGATDIDNAGADVSLTQANEFTGAVDVEGADVALTDANALRLGDVTATGSLTVAASGTIDQAVGTSLTVTLASNFDATGGDMDAVNDGDVAVANENNDFTGAVSVEAAAFAVRDANDLTIDAAIATAGGDRLNTLTSGGSTTVTGEATIAATSDLTATTGAGLSAVDVTADRLTADGGGADVTVSGATDIVSVSVSNAAAISIEDDGGIDLAGVTGSSLILTSDGGPVTDSAATDITGDASITATGQNVTLDILANDFGGAVSATGADVTLVDADDIELNVVSATTLMVDALGGDILDTNDTARLTIGGASRFSAADDINVNQEDTHTFGVEVVLSADQIIEFASIGDVTFGAVTATNTGDVRNQIQSGGGVVTLNGAVSTLGDSDFQVRLRGDVSQTSGTITTDQLIVTSIGADTDATLDRANDARAFTVNRNAGVQLGDIVFTDVNAVDLAGVLATSLTVTAGGEVTNSGALDVEAATTITALNQSVMLANGANDFSGTVNVTGADVSLADANDIQLGAVTASGTLTVTASGTIADTAGLSITVTDATSLTAQSGMNAFDIALDNDEAADRHDFIGAVSASGEDVTLVDANAIELGAVSATGDADSDDAINADEDVDLGDPGDLIVIAATGVADGDAGAITVTGNASFTTRDGGAAITLDNATHTFDSDGADAEGDGDARRDFVTFRGEGAVTIADSDDFYVYQARAAGDVALTAAAGSLTLETVEAAGGGALLGVADDGAIEGRNLLAGAINLGGTGSDAAASTAATGAVTLANALALNSIDARSAVRTDLTDVVSRGTMTTRAPQQRFENVGVGDLGANIGVAATNFNDVIGAGADVDLLTLDRMTFANGVSIEAGEIRIGTLRTLSGGGLSATALSGDVAKLADADLSDPSQSGFSVERIPMLAAEVVGDGYGAFTQVINVAGDATLAAAAGDVILTRGVYGGAGLDADFGGTVSLTAGGDAALEDVDAITLGAVDVGGDFAVRANTDNSAGGVDGISQLAATSITVGGTASFITGEHGGALNADGLSDVILTESGNDFNNLTLIASSADILDANGVTLTRGDVSEDLTLGTAAAPVAGALTVNDTRVGGDFAFDATGLATLNRIAVGGASATSLSGEADAGVVAVDLSAASGSISLTSTAGSISVDDFSLNDFAFAAAQSLTLTDGDLATSAGGFSTAGTEISLANVSMADGDFAASTTITADAVRASSLTLNGDAGVRLGAVAVAGDFDANAGFGSIETTDAATAAPADVVIDQIAGTFGFDSSVLVAAEAGGTDPSDLRVNDDLGAGAGSTTLARTDFDLQVSVGGATDVAASASILIPREAVAAGGLHNDFAGPVTISSNVGGVVIETIGDIALADVNSGSSLTIRTNSDNSAARGAAGITQTGTLSVGGAATFITGDHAGGAIADEARLSDVTLTGAMNDLRGDLSIIADNASIAETDGGFTLRDSRVANTLTVTVADATAASSLTIADVRTGADATFSTGGAIDIDRIAVGGALDVDSAASTVAANDVRVGGATTMDALGALVLDDAALQAATLTAGATATLTDLTTRAISATAGGVTISGLSSDAATIVSSAGFDGALMTTDAATITASTTIALTDARVDGVLRATNSGAAITVADVGVAGAAIISGGPVSTAPGEADSRLAIGGALSITSSGAVDLSDVAVAGATTIAAAGGATLDDFALAALTLNGGAVALSDGAADALALTSNAAARVVNLRADALTVQAVGDARLDDIVVAGAATIRSAAGDAALGGVNVGGRLAVNAGGDVFTVNSDGALAAVTVDGPNAFAAPAFVVEAPDAAQIGQVVVLPGSPMGETRVTETTLAVADLAATPASGAAGLDIVLGGQSTNGLLTVAGGADVRAAGDVALVDDAIGVALNNDFQNGITVVAGGDAIIDDRNDLTIDAVSAGGALRIVSGGAVDDGAAGRLDIGRDALFQAVGDIALDNATHAIGGAAAFAGAEVTVTEAGSVTLGRVAARGDLRVRSGATGGAGDAAITQVGSVTVGDRAAAASLDGASAAASVNQSGAIVVNGDVILSSGLAPGASLGAVSAGADRDVSLANDGNVFGGALALSRISGDATIVEESSTATAATDGLDGGVLEVGAFEVGGSAQLTTTDDVVFLGRLTTLADSDDDAPALTPATGGGAAAPALADGVETEDFRMLISTGETFTIDTTGGGVQAAGGDVRFDRPIDGDNDQPSVGTPQIDDQRDGLGALAIDAGTGGDIRFRDFVGAANPLGDVTLTGARIIAGSTFAETIPSTDIVAASPDERFLFDSAAPNDFFFADDLNVTFSEQLLFAVPGVDLATFIEEDTYFGLNVSSFSFDVTGPVALASAQAFGFIDDTRQRAGGLLPSGPRSDAFEFNDCVIGDVADCTNLPTPNVVNTVLILEPPLLQVNDQDLLELFGSFGNEELWGVPQSFFSDFGDDAEVEGECERGEDGECVGG